MCSNTHCCDPPTLCCSVASSPRQQTPQPLNHAWKLWKTGLEKHGSVWAVGPQGELLCVSSAVLCCPFLQNPWRSASLHEFSPNLCVQGRCLYVEVAARQALSLYTTYSTWAENSGFASTSSFAWSFWSDPWKAACCHLLLLSPPFAVSPFLGCKLFKMLSVPVKCLAQSFFSGQWGI